MAVFDFIEGWYNPHRRHSALGYQSPNAFERESQELGSSAPEPPFMNERRRSQEGPGPTLKYPRKRGNSNSMEWALRSGSHWCEYWGRQNAQGGLCAT
jgi:hypothetical protein